jgi:hypothetical protein
MLRWAHLSDAHGGANAAQLSFFEQHGAFIRDSASGRSTVDVPKTLGTRGIPVDIMLDQGLEILGLDRRQ